MVRAFLLLFVWGPALLGFALGWLVRHPADWTGPAVVGPLALLLTIVSYRWGLRRRAQAVRELQAHFVVGMVSGALVGVMVFGMLVARVIG